MTRERRPSWIVLGVLVVVGSGLAFAFWASQVGGRADGLALSRNVAAGEQLGQGDFTVVSVGADERLALVPPARREELVGRIAAGDLPAGTLVAEGMLVDDAELDSEHALVGITVSPGELPLQGLRTGTSVALVETPGEGIVDESGSAVGPVVWLAHVYSVGETEDLTGAPAVFVSLRVKTRDAPAVAAAAAQGRVRLVLVSSIDDVPGDLLFADALAGGGGPDADQDAEVTE